MKYLSENNQPLPADDDNTVRQMLFDYNLNEKDYFLSHRVNWQIIMTDVFQFKIGNSIHNIPSGHFILIGDETGEMDWIKVDEMIDRDIECVSFDVGMSTWRVDKPQLVGHIPEKEYYWPTTPYAIPIVDNNRVVVVSERDHYHTTKHYLIGIFLGDTYEGDDEEPRTITGD